MARILFLLVCALSLLASSTTSAAIIERTFEVGNLTLARLCESRVITAVNNSLPGPTILAREGDTLIVHVINRSPDDLTIHWHGIFQLMTGWSDGPAYATQCPIRPGNTFTYRFTLNGQEGTLWYHAHISWVRATVYGALIIQPRAGRLYPFPRPYQEIPILLGEWYKGNVVDIENEAIATGGAPNISDAYTINGLPGNLYNCSSNDMYRVTVVPGRTYLLRIINAALNNQLYFKIARHNFTVVAVDASYTEPYNTDLVVLAPGQTADVLLTTNQPRGDYYMAARPYASAPAIRFDNSTTRGVFHYDGATSSAPVMPDLPLPEDTPPAHQFYTNLTSLRNGPHFVPVPLNVDEHMFITFGLGLLPCGGNNTCNNPFGPQFRFAASMNNVSFVFPSRTSMLEAFYSGTPAGIYTEDFPDRPPIQFNYTSDNLNQSLWMTETGTRVKKLKFNSTVEIVLQNTALIFIENHPMHLHGFNFHVLAQGFGNYDPVRDPQKFNLVNPQERNTIAVPVGGWAVIRFRANNPGVWLMHCHLDVHVPWGLSNAFVVENGPTPATTLPPPPPDLPRC